MLLDEKTDYDVTDWFDFWNKPVRVGFYQVHTPYYKDNHYSYWNGEVWLTCVSVPKMPKYYEKSSDMYQTGAKWRGLTYKMD